MKNKTIYIKSVMVVFLLLIFTRIPALVYGTADNVTLVSTIVEFAFLIWGVIIISNKPDAVTEENKELSTSND